MSIMLMRKGFLKSSQFIDQLLRTKTELNKNDDSYLSAHDVSYNVIYFG